MRWRRQLLLNVGEKVAVMNPVERGEVLRGRLVGYRDGGRTAVVQHPHEFRTRRVPTDLVHRDH